MARPALSASRTAAILNLLSAHPERTFSMAEIVRETQINVASCHAVLAALTEAGFLVKLPRQKRFMLGPALVAAGQSALRSHPLIARAQQAAQDLHEELGTATLLASLVGSDVLALTSLADASGRTVGMSAGERRRFVPHPCLLFVAWASDEVARDVLAGAGLPDGKVPAEWRETMRLIRERGYQVTQVEGADHPLGEQLAEMAVTGNVVALKEPALALAGGSGRRVSQPVQIEAEREYEIVMIGAPIFDAEGRAAMTMALGGFSARLNGTQIEHFGRRLVHTCLRVMRDHRALDLQTPPREDAEAVGDSRRSRLS